MALQIARMLLRRYEEQQKQIHQMETVFRRMERIWNIKIDTENFKIEDAELPENPQSPV
jgi:hypothetical protein